MILELMSLIHPSLINGYVRIWKESYMFSDSFKDMKSKLFRQYANVDYDHATGLNVPYLRIWVDSYLESNKDMPRIRLKANIFAYLLDNAQIYVNRDDFYIDHLNHGNIMCDICEKWYMEAFKALDERDLQIKREAEKAGAYEVMLDLGHTSPDWNNLLALGVQGLKQRAVMYKSRLCANDIRDNEAECMNSDGKSCLDACDFYAAVEIVYDAVSKFILRLAKLAGEIGTPKMRFVSDDLVHIAQNPPETLHQALQLAYIYHELQEMEGEYVRSMGGFDRLYHRFYRSDLDNGILTRDQAKEIIKFFFYKFMAKTQGKAQGKNFLFAGKNSDGDNCENELSFLALEAYDEMCVVDPKFTVAVSPKTDPRFVEKAVNCIRKGNSSIVFVNDEITVKTLMKHGKTLEDAKNYTIIGCYEPAVMGKEISCTMAVTANLTKSVELTLFRGIDPQTGLMIGLGNDGTFQTFGNFYDEYMRQQKYQLTKAMDIAKKLEAKWRDVNPSPILSGTFESCMKSGLDISQGGATYNTTGVTCGCFASAVDSLSVIKELVYDRKTCTMDELKKVLEDDWAGHEDIRRLAFNCGKWGNNKDETDIIGKSIAESISDFINCTDNNRKNIKADKKGHFQMALFTIDNFISYGKKTGALPDGHMAGTPLSKNLSPVIAADKEGITAVINSVVKLDFTSMPNGSVLDIMLHPSTVQGNEGLKAFLSLIYTYFNLGGFAVHFNIFDKEVLMDAQKHPEKYETLQVRVCGWNSYFINLSTDAQNEFIKTAANL